MTPFSKDDLDGLDKIARYQEVVTKATTDIWNHMIQRLDGVPDSITELTDKQVDILMDVEAVEAEWILEDDIRQEISLIQYTDD